MRRSMIGRLVIGVGPARLPEEVMLPERRTCVLTGRAVLPRTGGDYGDRCRDDPVGALGTSPVSRLVGLHDAYRVTASPVD